MTNRSTSTLGSRQNVAGGAPAALTWWYTGFADTDSIPVESHGAGRVSGAGISIVLATNRLEPRWNWFVDSLVRQLMPSDELEVVFVDGHHSPERTAVLDDLVAGRFAFQHVPAKPSPYCGPHRLTQHDYFAAASARNTGVVYAHHPYVVFVDDRRVLMPAWWDAIRDAARQGRVVTGAFDQRADLVVEDGLLVSSGPSGLPACDVRWDELDSEEEPVTTYGGHLFGDTCGVPRQLLLAVNGWDELCDPAGQEDCQLGLRLELTGAPIFYSRRMLTVESLEPPDSHKVLRLDKRVNEQAYMQRLSEFGVYHRTVEGNTDHTHMQLDIVYGTRSPRSFGNYYELSELTAENILDTVARFPRRHWFDQEPLEEL